MGFSGWLVAISDAILSWIAFSLAQDEHGMLIRWDKSTITLNLGPVSASDSIGWLILGVAALIGTFRFSLMSSLKVVHEWMSGFSSAVGFPLIGLTLARIDWPSHLYVELFTTDPITYTHATAIALTLSYVAARKLGIANVLSRVMPVAFMIPLGAIAIFNRQASVAIPAIAALLLFVLGVATISALEDEASGMIIFHIFLALAIVCTQACIVNATSPHSSQFNSSGAWQHIIGLAPFIGKT